MDFDRRTPAASQRLFFALIPDVAVRREIERVQQQWLSRYGLVGRAVRPDSFHVTLAFLGQQPAARLPEILDLAAGMSLPSFCLHLNRLGIFPDAGVAWLGAKRLPSALRAFQARLAEELGRAKIAPDRSAWQFHLTLYRNLRTVDVRMEPDTVSWQPNEFSLVESIRAGQGVEYRIVGRWRAENPGGPQSEL